MANRTYYPVDTGRNETKIILATATGAGGANLVVPSGLASAGLISGTRTGAGTFDLVFRHKYPEGVCPLSPGIVGTTTGLVATFTVWNPAAGTATVKFAVGGVATDPAATDSIRFALIVRNSGRN